MTKVVGTGTAMAAEKLVLERQRHLKWRALDRLELALMVICGVLCFGFSLSVTLDNVNKSDLTASNFHFT